MKISIMVTDERTISGDRYAPKEKVTVIDLESMDADPRVIASMLRGVADTIYPPKQIFNTGTISGGTISVHNGNY